MKNIFNIKRASDLLKTSETTKFAEIIAGVYMATGWISNDYPNHRKHYFSKYVPGVFDGTREIIACYVDNTIAAIAILKKDDEERKISTLYIKPEYRKCEITDRLLEESFAWLETTHPLITVADYKLDQFTGCIKRYGWVETQILAEGYYNNHSREHVFNGLILKNAP